MRISVSQINEWLKCQRSWEFSRARKTFAPPSKSLIIGSAYHAALEENFKQKILTGVDLPVEKVKMAYIASVSETFDKWTDSETLFCSIPDSDNTADFCVIAGYRMIEKYMEEVAPGIEPAEVETSKWLDLGNHQLLCRIDLITTSGTVIDHKTSSRMKTLPDNSIQPAAYCLAVGSMDFQYHLITTAAKTAVSIQPIEITPFSLSWFVKLANSVADQMEKGICVPNPNGWWCSRTYCDYYDLCRTDPRKF